MSAQTEVRAMEGQLSFSFEIGRDTTVSDAVMTVKEQPAIKVLHLHTVPVTCISSRRPSPDKRDESDAYLRVMQYARSLRRI